MTIRKFMKTLALMLVGVLTLALLGGCGGTSEKFAGTWVGSGRYNQTDFDCFYTLQIDKNGKGYTINETRSYWDEKSYPGEPVHYTWTDKKTPQVIGNVKDNSIRFTPPGMMENSFMVTFIEKDGTLQYNTGDATITLHKTKDVSGELAKFKDSQKEDFTAKLNKIGRKFSFNQ